MKASHILTILPFLIPLTLATPLNPLVARTSCTAPSGAGTCQSTSSCTGFHVAGYCPGGSDNQCCISTTCSTSSGSGTCKNTGSGCSGGSFIAGACPGASDIQCCVAGDTSTPPPTSSGGDTGSKVVDAAEAEKGLPYVFGGGDTTGPTKGGFDCSGLTQYSVFKATGKTIPRTADVQYETSTGKHVPRAQAQKGDLIFWATGGNCGSAVEHVGIYISPGLMVNAATTGTPVREQSIWTSSGGLSICPDAVRFW